MNYDAKVEKEKLDVGNNKERTWEQDIGEAYPIQWALMPDNDIQQKNKTARSRSRKCDILRMRK